MDIDLRAVQLAALALYMKARVAEREAAKDDVPRNTQYRVNVVCADARLTNGVLRQRFLEEYKDDWKLQQVWQELFREMEDIAEVGSLLQPEERLRQLLETYQPPTIQLETTQQLELSNMPQKPRQMTLAEVHGGEQWSPRRTLKQMVDDLHRFASKALSEADVNAQLFAIEAEKTVSLLVVLSQEYEVVVMNPPYGDLLPQSMSLIKKLYPESKSNAYACFVERGVELLCSGGYLGALTERLFLTQETFESFRQKVLLKHNTIISLMDLWYGVLDEAMNRTAAYVISSSRNPIMPSVFFDLKTSNDKEQSFQELLDVKSSQNGCKIYVINLHEFLSMPRTAILYKLSKHMIRHFHELPSFGSEVGNATQGLITGNNLRFVRFHWEISENSSRSKWVSYAKGGDSDSYYKSHDFVVRYDENAKRFYDQRGRHQGQRNYFKEGISWGDVSEIFQAQYLLDDAINSQVSYSLPLEDDKLLWASLAYLNSNFVLFLLMNIYDGHHWGTKNVSVLPWQLPSKTQMASLEQCARASYKVKKAWDTANELARNFTLPWLLQAYLGTLLDGLESFNLNLFFSDRQEKSPNLSSLLQFVQSAERTGNEYLQQAQSEINSTIYDLYEVSAEDRGIIEGELEHRPQEVVWPQMRDKSTTEKRREHVRRLLSYFILQAIKADEDGILPFFPGTGHPTILEQLRHQLEKEFGVEVAFQLEDEASKELGRSVENWLDGHFIRWHTSLYKKRPILWHLVSPSNRFGVLLYYHKLDKDTLPKVRNVYLRTVRDSLRRQLDAARQASDNKAVDQLETTLDDFTQIDEKLQTVIESGYQPVIDDGVYVNILPLQEAGLLRYTKTV